MSETLPGLTAVFFHRSPRGETYSDRTTEYLAEVIPRHFLVESPAQLLGTTQHSDVTVDILQVDGELFLTPANRVAIESLLQRHPRIAVGAEHRADELPPRGVSTIDVLWQPRPDDIDAWLAMMWQLVKEARGRRRIDSR